MALGKDMLSTWLPLGTALLSAISFFSAWVVALDARLDNLEGQLFRVYSVVVSAQGAERGYCNIDVEKFLEMQENAK